MPIALFARMFLVTIKRMLKLYSGLIFACLLIVLTVSQAYAFSIVSKTEMDNGLRTTLCINQLCKTFEGALSAVPVDIEQQPLIIEVIYLGGDKVFVKKVRRTFPLKWEDECSPTSNSGASELHIRTLTTSAMTGMIGASNQVNVIKVSDSLYCLLDVAFSSRSYPL